MTKPLHPWYIIPRMEGKNNKKKNYKSLRYLHFSRFIGIKLRESRMYLNSITSMYWKIFTAFTTAKATGEP